MKKVLSSLRYGALSDAGRVTKWCDYQDLPELQSGQFISVMHQLDVDSRGLGDRMCAVQLPNRECVILVLPEYLHDDDVLALRIVMEQAGLTLASQTVVTVAASVLSAIARQERIEQRCNPGQLRLSDSSKRPGHVLFSVLDDMLAWAVKHDASDIHLGVYRGQALADVAFTVRGLLVRTESFAALSAELVHDLLSVVWMSVEGGNGAVFEPQREQQGRLERAVAGGRVSLRWASMASCRGPCVTLRLLQRERSTATTDLNSLGYTASQLRCLYRARLSTGGAVLIAGAVGSGKSTTLAAVIRGIPATRKVITLEDPVEFDLPNAVQCAITAFGDGQTDRERFDIKLQALKRSAANDVLIGEIRDQSSARALGDLLMAGVNVYSTIHAGSALQIVPRLCSPTLGLAPDLLAVPGVLKLLGYQMLLNALCPVCCMSCDDWLRSGNLVCALGMAQSVESAMTWLGAFEARHQIGQDQFRFRNSAGCPCCQTKPGCRGSDASAPDRAMRQAGVSRHLHGHPLPGFQGYLMAAEFIEPGRLTDLSAWVNSLHRQTSLPKEATAPPFHLQESASQMALSHVGQGRLDPREFELRFGGI